jgi:hypothetical protein
MVLEGFQIDDSVDTVSKQSQASAKDILFADNQTKINTFLTSDGNLETGQQSTLEAAESAMSGIIEWYKLENESLKGILQNAQNTAFSFSSTLNNKKMDVEKLRAQVEEERNLNAVRTEQVASLENRYAAGYYSSWMGLTRPLKEESHIGLLVAAGAFVLLGLFAIYYMYRMDVLHIPALGLFSNGFRGGARNRGHR